MSSDPIRRLDEMLFGTEADGHPPGVHPAALEDDQLAAQCELTRGRSGGPGGQHRNKTSTHVTLVHRPTGIEAQAGEQRSSEANRKRAMRRLRLQLAVKIRTGVPAGDCRTPMWVERTRNRRISCNPKHADFPAMLALAMDVIDACGCDFKAAAVRLAVTPSQLLKLIRECPPALIELNQARAERGLKDLR